VAEVDGLTPLPPLPPPRAPATDGVMALSFAASHACASTVPGQPLAKAHGFTAVWTLELRVQSDASHAASAVSARRVFLPANGPHVIGDKGAPAVKRGPMAGKRLAGPWKPAAAAPLTVTDGPDSIVTLLVLESSQLGGAGVTSWVYVPTPLATSSSGGSSVGPEKETFFVYDGGKADRASSSASQSSQWCWQLLRTQPLSSEPLSSMAVCAEAGRAAFGRADGTLVVCELEATWQPAHLLRGVVPHAKSHHAVLRQAATVPRAHEFPPTACVLDATDTVLTGSGDSFLGLFNGDGSDAALADGYFVAPSVQAGSKGHDESDGPSHRRRSHHHRRAGRRGRRAGGAGCGGVFGAIAKTLLLPLLLLVLSHALAYNMSLTQLTWRALLSIGVRDVAWLPQWMHVGARDALAALLPGAAKGAVMGPLEAFAAFYQQYFEQWQRNLYVAVEGPHQRAALSMAQQ
jgi:hypothetical protein